MLRYYISGPMTGLPQYNYPMFEYVSTKLRSLGMEISSPHENPLPPDIDVISESELWDQMIALSIEQMNSCDAIILLPGWTRSRGAKLELEYMLDRDKEVYFLYLRDGITLCRMDEILTAPSMPKYSNLENRIKES